MHAIGVYYNIQDWFLLIYRNAGEARKGYSNQSKVGSLSGCSSSVSSVKFCTNSDFIVNRHYRLRRYFLRSFLICSACVVLFIKQFLNLRPGFILISKYISFFSIKACCTSCYDYLFQLGVWCVYITSLTHDTFYLGAKSTLYCAK